MYMRLLFEKTRIARRYPGQNIKTRSPFTRTSITGFNESMRLLKEKKLKKKIVRKTPILKTVKIIGKINKTPRGQMDATSKITN